MRDRVTKVRARLAILKNERVKAPRRLTKAKEYLADADDEFARNEEQLGELVKTLKTLIYKDIADRERRRDELLDELQKIDRNIGVLTSNIETSSKKRTKLVKISMNLLRKTNKPQFTVVDEKFVRA